MPTDGDKRVVTEDAHAHLADAWKKFTEQIDAIRSMTDAISREMKTNKPRRTDT